MVRNALRCGSPCVSTRTIRYPGNGRPIDPARTGWPGELPTCAVVSVWPYPSRIVRMRPARTPANYGFSTVNQEVGGSNPPAPVASPVCVYACGTLSFLGTLP